LILKYLPQLEKFLLQYHESIDDDFIFPTYSGELNQFTSSFWIERQWLLETEIDYEYIKYLIRPYKYVKKSLSYEIDCLFSFRTRWYEYADDNSSIDLSKSARLNIMDMSSLESYESIIKYIKRILSITKIYHLEISESQTFIDLLIQIIDLLPEINLLKIHSLSYDKPEKLSGEET
jgi:hypothetical protein